MGYSILLVDDSRVIMNAIGKVFEMTKLPMDHVYEAGNGKEALKLVEEHWVDLIFCDINMPIMNGIEMVRRLRENTETKELPVVMLTSDGAELRIKELEAIGIDGYLRKPARPEEIRDKIHEILGEWENDD